MGIYHKIDKTTCEEPTSLDEYKSRETPVSREDDEIQWFPDMNTIFEPETESRGKLGSKWSVTRTNILFREYQKIENKSNWKGSHVKIGLSKLINLINEVYGIDNWMNRVESSWIEHWSEDRLEVKSKVSLILADNTIVEQEGIGIGVNLPREMMFRKCKKESVSDALRKCIVRLVVLLMDYEEKVRSGYYEKYR